MAKDELTGIKLADILYHMIDTRMKEHLDRVSLAMKSLNASGNQIGIKGLSEKIVDCYINGGTTYWFGNGGSATQASHMAGELVGGYKIKDRKSLSAIALTADSGVLTALGNDYSYKDIFAKQLERFGAEDSKDRDVAVGITTSGGSQNVYLGLKAAKKNGLITCYLGSTRRGKYYRQLCDVADYRILVDGTETGVIQDVHEMILHIVAECVERFIFEKKKFKE